MRTLADQVAAIVAATVIAGAALVSLPTPTRPASAATSAASLGTANAGVSGSPCVSTDNGRVASAPPAGTTTTGLGEAPGYYEVTRPSGITRGVVLLIHGGGWFVVGPAAVAGMRPTARSLAAAGMIVVSVTSAAGCGSWLEDLTWFYDEIAHRWPSLPVCAYGASAGGHLALLASQRDVDCVVSMAGPTDLTSDETVANYATAAFGEDALSSMSPLFVADRISAQVLLAIADGDPLVPNGIDAVRSALDASHPKVTHEAIVLDAGEVWWVHSGVTQASLDTFNAAAMNLIRAATAE